MTPSLGTLCICGQCSGDERGCSRLCPRLTSGQRTRLAYTTLSSDGRQHDIIPVWAVLLWSLSNLSILMKDCIVHPDRGFKQRDDAFRQSSSLRLSPTGRVRRTSLEAVWLHVTRWSPRPRQPLNTHITFHAFPHVTEIDVNLSCGISSHLAPSVETGKVGTQGTCAA